jgi:hypothetical protein
MKTKEKIRHEGEVVKRPIKHRKSEQLQTDPPISEKDEVKQAENRTQKLNKKS